MTALISATRLSSGSGGRPVRFFARSRMRSIRLERETPITSATVFIVNRPSAATAAAAAVFLTPWRVRALLEDLSFQEPTAAVFGGPPGLPAGIGLLECQRMAAPHFVTSNSQLA